jgi:hypothetical protein
MNAPSNRQPITDSPWFWAYLFGTAALLALAIIGPKFGPRQAQLEREFQGRQRAAQHQAGDAPTVAMSEADETIIGLAPLFFALAGVTIVAWIVFWRTHSARQASRARSAMASGGREPPEISKGASHRA